MPQPEPKPVEQSRESVLAELAAELGGLSDQLDPKYVDRFRAITELTDAFCLDHLPPVHIEYLIACRGLAAACCQDGSPVVEGRAKARTWAAAIAYTIGWVNLLADPDSDPTMTSREVADAFKLSVGTMQSRSTEIREGLEIQQLQPDWTLPDVLIRNPNLWRLENEEGEVVDIRMLPRQEQEIAFDQGVIPFIPADLDLEEGMMLDFDEEEMVGEDDEYGPLPPDVIGRIFPES